MDNFYIPFSPQSFIQIWSKSKNIIFRFIKILHGLHQHHLPETFRTICKILRHSYRTLGWYIFTCFYFICTKSYKQTKNGSFIHKKELFLIYICIENTQNQNMSSKWICFLSQKSSQ